MDWEAVEGSSRGIF